MRQKKIRGHKRRHNHIEKWRLDNISLDINRYLLHERDTYHTKIMVPPWSGISITNSITPEPKGKTKRLMLCGLLDIYEHWKIQLDMLGQAYYLRIWLFEPRFSQSQVVCATGNSIDFYENSFYKPNTNKPMRLMSSANLHTKLSEFTWEYGIDEHHFASNELGEPESYRSQHDYDETYKWFNRLLKTPHRTDTYTYPHGETIDIYSWNRGDVWIGKR
ncbi:MAG: hypothetical protein JNL32_07275 [Candidatus Kapabacteria bacterium]|nr:hypothetical protein [Candidatus Kapabacteria bacterium]